MDASMAYQWEFNSYLCETLLETDLNRRHIDLIFNAILSLRTFSEKKTLFILGQGKLRFGLLAHLTPKMEQMLFDSGSCISRTGKEIVLDSLREKKIVYIISVFGESVLITNRNVLRRLTMNITRGLEKGNLVKRYIDSDILLAILIEANFREKEKKEENYVCEMSNFDEPEEKKDLLNDSRIKNGAAKISRKSTILPVVPRHPHTTTVTNPEITFPNNRKKYSQPMYPECRETVNNHAGDRYPTQVSETDAGEPSFESSLIHMPSRFIGSRHAGQEEANVFSAPDVAYERQIAINRNVVTSGTRIRLPAKPARYPDYTEQQKRETTFHTPNWHVHNKPNPILLAECGFFFTEKQDLVRCYHCGIGLKDWIQEDDVLTEHVKHSSSCDFLVQKFGKIRIDRMKMAVFSEHNNENNSRVDVPQLPYKIRSPRYQTMEARVASFKDFPKHTKLSPQQLAVAGLYFTGNGDLCRCFTCDGGLKDWSTGDDPVKEHATYFPNCTYIGHLKGPEYVQLLQQNRPGNEPMGAAGGSNAITQPTQTLPSLPLEKMTIVDTNTEYSSFNVTQVVQQLGYAEIDVITAKAELEKKGKRFPTAEDIVNTLLDMQERTEHFQTVVSSKENRNDLQAMVEENKELSRLIYCMLCITGEADMLFLPCTHHRTCHECAVDLIFCPVCNEFIKEKIKTFRS